MKTLNASPRLLSRMGGAIYLVMIVSGMLSVPLLFAGLFLPARASAQEDRAMVPAPVWHATGPGEQCREDGPGDPRALIDRARDAVGIRAGRILHYRSTRYVQQNFQSDRSYPPYFSSMSSDESWVDPVSGTMRTQGTFNYPAFTVPAAGPATIMTATAAWIRRGEQMIPGSMSREWTTRPLDAWATLADWRDSDDLRSGGICTFREYPRDVVIRKGPYGEERLYLDRKTGIPIRLARQEPHYLWGQLDVDYLWTLWYEVEGGEGPAFFPLGVFRYVDGAVDVGQTVGSIKLIAPDPEIEITLPDSLRTMPDRSEAARQALRPDTVRISEWTALLVTRAYTEGVTLLRDTVWVLDSTMGEERARLDHERIRALFPGDHPVAVLVTDLAWPHIAGVRYWVSEGATIVSHPNFEFFLRRVVERRWTLEPDQLERRRASSPFRFRAVEDGARLAGGDLRIHTIDGVGSESALIAFVVPDRFLWASDFIQGIQGPSTYTRDVVAAVRRAGLRPERFAAQHTPINDWALVEALVGR